MMLLTLSAQVLYMARVPVRTGTNGTFIKGLKGRLILRVRYADVVGVDYQQLSAGRVSKTFGG